MRFYLNWLKQYVNIDSQPSDIADKLTLAGTEVSECSLQGGGIENVITAEVIKIKKHPNADTLSVCQISNGREILSVVCGASNIKERDRVPLAMVGAVLPGDIKIKKSKIRGETSLGMLCSGKELGITSDSEGIHILPKDTPLGRDVCELLNLKNWQFELEITPNRGDLLSMIGIAREIGVLTGKTLNLPEIKDDGTKERDSSEGFKVEIKEPDLCPRYCAAIVKGVKVNDSPQWLKRRLEGAGLRSINSIVDITNFVMLEMGQPLHAFDLSKIGGKTIVVRRAKPGEILTTLDGEKRKFDPMDLAICDISKPLAIAGVMGGADSEITEKTQDILIESAWFDPRTVRKTSKRLSLLSDSSYRFERGIDPLNVKRALLRAASLIVEVSGGDFVKDVIDVYPKKYNELKLILKCSKIKKVLGIEVPSAKVKSILEGLGMKVSSYGDVDFEVLIPSFRPDITQEVDLIEELARIYGYHLIPSTLPETLAEPEFLSKKYTTLKGIESVLLGSGFNQVKNYSFIAEAQNSLFTGNKPEVEGKPMRVLNPISEDMNIMRQNLLSSLLKNISYNIARGISDIKIFEIDKTFHVFNGTCHERLNLSVAICGKDSDLRWDYSGREMDFFDLKGIYEEICERLNLKAPILREQSKLSYMHPGISVDFIAKDETIGSMGLLHPDILEKYDIPNTYILNLLLDDFIKDAGGANSYKPYSLFPKVERDISILVDLEVRHGDIVEAIRKNKCDFLKDIKVFDQYTGNQVPKGKKSLSYRLIYQSQNRTLREEEVTEIHETIIKSLSSDVKAELRK